MSDDTSTNNQEDNSKSDNSTLKINNQNASNWMVRDIIFGNYFDFSSWSKRVSDSVKKIGSYVGKIKNTIISFQKEISSTTQKIEIDQDDLTETNKKKEDISKNG